MPATRTSRSRSPGSSPVPRAPRRYGAAYRRLRAALIADRMRAAGGDAIPCDECGRVPRRASSYRVRWRDGRPMRHHDLECDHVVPLAAGGEDTLSNLRLLCAKCHYRRKDPLAGQRDAWDRLVEEIAGEA